MAEPEKFPTVELSRIAIAEDVFHLIPERIARKHKIVPFFRDSEGIRVAVVDPNDTRVQQLLAKKTGQKIFTYLATEKDIQNAFTIYKKDLQTAFNELLKKEGWWKNINIAQEEAPITKIVDLLVNNAYQDKASDIHIEPQENDSLIRFRIDGILHDVLHMPKNFHERVISRIKVLSSLRTDEHLAPQDGKMRVKLEEENLDIRVAIIPIADGEKAVLRLLSSRSRQISLVELGINETDLKKVENAFSKPFGMILSTGPTGSGKTTTIYAILKILNSREKNITTIEDPIEYRIKGVNQIQANPKANLTFAQGLRSILRQDPNVIFVGEIRDVETAGIAVNAALTGHLVLSTLHTNDAATALPRLSDMKVEPFLVASTVNIILAQRLVRKICENCRTSYTVKYEEIAKNLPVNIVKKHFNEQKEINFFKGVGCKICHLTGYLGRIGIFEILEMSNPIRKLIIEKKDADDIENQAIDEGMNTMLDDGLEKVKRGFTTIEEVLRVTKVELA